MPNNLVLNEQIDYAELFTLWYEHRVVGNRCFNQLCSTFFIAASINIYDTCGRTHGTTL